MPSMNKCFFIGHLAKKPNTRISNDGTKIWTEATLAVSEGYGDDAETMWLRCSVFGKGGERMLEKCDKGDAIMVIGKITARPYIDKQNKPHAGMSLLVNEWHYLKQSTKNAPIPQYTDSLQPVDPMPPMDGLSDIPF